MALIQKTMFEVLVSNSTRNGTQNVAGKFGTYADETFTPDVCSAGFMCEQAALIPSEGYEAYSILNGNTWYFVAATDGEITGQPGDHTGIYAFNNYDVNKVTSGELQYNLGANTLGLSLPADTRGDFTELIVGEQYGFGSGNFSAVPNLETQGYATISNGLWTPATEAPASGVYAQILRSKNVTEGTSNWGTEYVLKIFRA